MMSSANSRTRFTGPFNMTVFIHSIVVEVRMHGRDGQIVMFMLNAGEALCQFAFVMVVHIREVGDAHTFGGPPLRALLQVMTQNICTASLRVEYPRSLISKSNAAASFYRAIS